MRHNLHLAKKDMYMATYPEPIYLTVDEYDYEWNDKKHEFLDLSWALSDLCELYQTYPNHY